MNELDDSLLLVASSKSPDAGFRIPMLGFVSRGSTMHVSKLGNMQPIAVHRLFFLFRRILTCEWRCHNDVRLSVHALRLRCRRRGGAGVAELLRAGEAAVGVCLQCPGGAPAQREGGGHGGRLAAAQWMPGEPISVFERFRNWACLTSRSMSRRLGHCLHV
jgi:hypothetical protein